MWFLFVQLVLKNNGHKMSDVKTSTKDEFQASEAFY